MKEAKLKIGNYMYFLKENKGQKEQIIGISSHTGNVYNKTKGDEETGYSDSLEYFYGEVGIFSVFEQDAFVSEDELKESLFN